MDQRPHHFCKDLVTRFHAQVLWLDPMPSRFPKWQDAMRTRQRAQEGPSAPYTVLTAPPWPVEPSSDGLTDWATASLRRAITARGPFDWVILGKPSRLALSLVRDLRRLHPSTRVLWDYMDDMPAFHHGRAALRMQAQEEALWPEVDLVWASSKRLLQKAQSKAKLALWVPNGISASAYAPRDRFTPIRSKRGQASGGLVLGYVGSIAPWFDWDALHALAAKRPKDTIRLIGPVHTRLPHQLASNIELIPPVAHAQVPQTLAGFDWGLIPFKESALTEAVDPIKFYEYRAAGLPVLSTPFGDMRPRTEADGVWTWQAALNHPGLLDQIAESGCQTQPDWIAAQDWSCRFAAAWQETEALVPRAYNPPT